MRHILILHVITGLSVGGAEMSLLRLLRNLDAATFNSRVVALGGMGEIGERIQGLGVPVTCLGMRVGSGISAVMSLRSIIRKEKPDILHGWMYHANLASLIGKFVSASEARLIWSVRSSLNNMAVFKPKTRAVIKVCAALSSRPDRIIYNSSASAEQHRRAGFVAKRAMVIGNGIDETEFRLVPNERDALRRQLGIGQDEVVVGTVGRFHLAKGSDRFLALMSKLADRDPRVHVLCVGRGMDWSNPEVAAAPGISQIRDRCHMVGEQAEVPRYLSAMDIFVSPSRTEGFPNALAEAMMVGLPCVATDVGASAIVLGDAGALVGCDDIDGLAIAVRKQLQMTSEQRRDMGAAARRHAVDICSVQQCVQEYSSLYSSLFRGKEVS